MDRTARGTDDGSSVSRLARASLWSLPFGLLVLSIVSVPLSILDDDLTGRIAAAFALHPWVAKVVRVTKHHPAGVDVEDVALTLGDVDVTDQLVTGDDAQGLLWRCLSPRKRSADGVTRQAG